MCMLPSNGQKINLKVREIINMEEKRKKQSSAAQICILYFIYIILILYTFLWNIGYTIFRASNS